MDPIFKYCPNCKSPHLIFDKGIKITCTDCDFEFYHNTAGAVAVIIQKEDKILLTVRNKDPQKGYLDLAGGFIDPAETAEFSCVRELKEELNIDIDKTKLQYINSNPNTYLYKNILYNTIDLFFLYRDDHLLIEDFDTIELKGFLWKKITEIDIDELAFESQKKTLSLLKKQLNKG
ncbi:NUDIX hydrolase [Apibacter adventoris]|uniref:NUDIX hydrolase n=1 Tax=Apibacter adventoris TaxID=1679466 RepID=A0A2S8AE09_9FLAO|nr:NUDIX domain-containing protein [Apibacter adventoris]PQL93192.1 NUDIX hydrolase [Apibacter adventoris]